MGTDFVLAAQEARRRYVPIGNHLTKHHVFGHSYAEGFGTTYYPFNPLGRATALLSRWLGAEEVNHAISGGEATLAQRGMLGRIYNRTAPPSVPTKSALVQLASIWIGANDVGDSLMYTVPTLFPALVTTACRRLRASQVLENSDAAWVFAQNGGASNWGTSTSGNYKSGASSTAAGSAQSVGATGNKFTLTLPTTYQGEPLFLVGLHIGAGFTFTMTIDGVAATAWDTTAIDSSTAVYPDVYSLGALAPGTHTIVGTCTVLGGPCQIDYAMMEAPNLPGILLYQLQAAPTQPSGPGTHTPVTQANLDTFNGYLQAVAATFSDGMVKYVPLTLDVSTAAYWITAGDHPSDLGHEVIATQLLAFVLATGWLPTLNRGRVQGGNTFARLRIAGHFDDSAADRVTLVAGTATLSSRAITSLTRAILTRVGTNANAGHLNYGTIVATTTSAAGTMVISSSNGADTSVVDVLLYDAVTAS